MLRSTRILATALLIAGCAAPASPDPQDGSRLFPPTAQVEALRLPFDAYTFSLAQLYTISNAVDLLAGECMRAKGLAWDAIKRPTDLEDLRNRRRYGVIEIRIAQQSGYHVPAGLLTPLDVEQQYDQRDAGLSESQNEAAFGEHGCSREAAKRLRPAGTPDPSLLQQLDRESLAGSHDEPRVAEAMRSWRDCIREASFDYQDPFAALSDTQWWTNDGAGPSPRERAVAIADVRCKQQSGLVEAWHTAEVRAQEEAITRHPEYFQKLDAAMKAELAAAHAAILAHS